MVQLVRLVGKALQPSAHVARRSEAMRDARDLASDRVADAAEFRQHRKGCVVGGVVADEYRAAAGKWWMAHQPANGTAFVEAGTLDFDHRLAGEDLDGVHRPLR